MIGMAELEKIKSKAHQIEKFKDVAELALTYLEKEMKEFWIILNDLDIDYSTEINVKLKDKG